MANWATFLTAIQLVAGLNVALYALPGLRNPEIVDEPSLFGVQSTVAKLVSAANEAGMFEEAISVQERLRGHWQPILQQFALARGACLVAATFASAVLLRGTGQWAEACADLWLAWGTIGVGFLPAGWLVVLNLLARSYRSKAGEIRRAMEARVAEALLEAKRAEPQPSESAS